MSTLDNIAYIVFQVTGGLGLFLLGMKFMSEGLQNIAGNRLRKLVSTVTNNRFLGICVGTLVTALFQSSSATTVMVVGFVNSGFMTLTQAIGVIMGANIGTTMTVWILAIKVGKYSLPILGIFALVYRFAKNEKWRFIAMAIMGVGMVFFGMELMTEGFKPLRSDPAFAHWFALFSADNFLGVVKCVSIGCLLTMIIQSSAASIGITIGLASTGAIHFDTAAALGLGANIGTTITAILASFGATTNAKRAAYAHTIFNILGVVWVIFVFHPYINAVKAIIFVDPDTVVLKDGIETYPYIAAGIAAVHTAFNIANTIVFLPFVNKLAGFLHRVIPDKKYKEPPHLTHLDIRLMETPAIGMEQSRVELLQMGEIVRKMIGRFGEILNSEKEPDDDIVRKVFHAEETLDIIQKEIVVFLTDLLSRNVSHEIAAEGRRDLRMADELESVSDYVARLLKLYLRLLNEGEHFTKAGDKEMLDLYNDTANYFNFIQQSYQMNSKNVLRDAKTTGEVIIHKIQNYRTHHLHRVSEKKISPLNSTTFTDMLTAWRRISDHILNIAEVIEGVK